MNREPKDGPLSGDKIDLSPAAIRQRLDEVGQLYELGLYLAGAKPLPVSGNGTLPPDCAGAASQDRKNSRPPLRRPTPSLTLCVSTPKVPTCSSTAS